jgi:hypothetical protein
MKRLRVSVGALVLAAGSVHAVGQNSPDTSAALIIQNERALYQAVAKADQAAFQSLTLPSGIWATPSGFVPLGPLAGGLSAFEVPTWEIDNPRVVWTDSESALLLYTRSGGREFRSRAVRANDARVHVVDEARRQVGRGVPPGVGFAAVAAAEQDSP